MSQIVPDPHHFNLNRLTYTATLMADKLKKAKGDISNVEIPPNVLADAARFCKDLVSACDAEVNGPYEASLYVSVSNVLTMTLGRDHTNKDMEGLCDAAEFLRSVLIAKPEILRSRDLRRIVLMADFFAKMAEVGQEQIGDVDENDD